MRRERVPQIVDADVPQVQLGERLLEHPRNDGRRRYRIDAVERGTGTRVNSAGSR